MVLYDLMPALSDTAVDIRHQYWGLCIPAAIVLASISDLLMMRMSASTSKSVDFVRGHADLI